VATPTAGPRPHLPLPPTGCLATMKITIYGWSIRVGSKTFAMLRNSELVVKLSTQRVDQLVVSGIGARFDPRHDGRR